MASTATPFIEVEKAKGIEQRKLQDQIDRELLNRENQNRDFERGLFDDTFGENQRQFNNTFGEGQRQFDLGFGEGQRQFNTNQTNKENVLAAFGLGGNGGLGQQGSLDGGPPPLGGGDFQQTGLAEGTLFGDLLAGDQAGFSNFLADQRSQRDSILGQVQDFGQGLVAQQNQDFSDARGSQQAAFEGRGLGASNLVAAANAGLTREQNIGAAQLQDQLLGRRIDTEQGLNAGINSSISENLAQGNQRRLQGIQTIGGIGQAIV